MSVKLGAPGNPELAIGAVDETGWVYLTEEAGPIARDSRYIEMEKTEQLALMQARRKMYTPVSRAA